MAKKTTTATPKVTLEWTRKIAAARDAMKMVETDFREAEARFNSVIAKALYSVGAAIEGNIVCLTCGSVRSIDLLKTPCTTCNPARVQRPPLTAVPDEANEA